jgi:hypothetical protein
MRLGRVHLADVVGRARASFAGLAVRPHGPGLRNLVGRLRGSPSYIDPAEAAAYEEATRQAFRTGTRVEPPGTPVHVPTVGSTASVSIGTRAITPISELATPAVGAPAKLGRDPQPTTMPRWPRHRTGEIVDAPMDESAQSMPGPARSGGPAAAPAAPAAVTGSEPARAPADSEPQARRPNRQAGETAPDFLLRTPTSVAPIVDDFFDGLIRRVEGDR